MKVFPLAPLSTLFLAALAPNAGAQGADDQTVFLRPGNEIRACFPRRIQQRAGFLVGDQFDCADKSDTHGLSNEWMIGKGMQAFQEWQACLFDPGHQIHFFINFQRLERDGSRHRVP